MKQRNLTSRTRQAAIGMIKEILAIGLLLSTGCGSIPPPETDELKKARGIVAGQPPRRPRPEELYKVRKILLGTMQEPQIVIDIQQNGQKHTLKCLLAIGVPESQDLYYSEITASISRLREIAVSIQQFLDTFSELEFAVSVV